MPDVRRPPRTSRRRGSTSGRTRRYRRPRRERGPRRAQAAARRPPRADSPSARGRRRLAWFPARAFLLSPLPRPPQGAAAAVTYGTCAHLSRTNVHSEIPVPKRRWATDGHELPPLLGSAHARGGDAVLPRG